MGGSDGTCSTATTAGDWEQTAESNSEGGCKSFAGATVPGTPWPCVIHQTHLVLEMLCRDEEKQNTMGLGLFFPPFESNGTAQGWAGAGHSKSAHPGHARVSAPFPWAVRAAAALPVLAEPQELWPVIKSSLLGLSDLLGSGFMATGGTSKLGFYFISSRFPSH